MAATDEVKIKVTADTAQATSAFQKIQKNFNSVQESASKFALGAGVATAGLGGLVMGMLDGAGKAEQLQVAFTTMIGDADKAKETLASLTDFAAKTPFQLPEVQDAAKKLLAFGTAAEDIEPTLRKLGDVSAGIGAPIGEIAEIYGKARVQGRLFAEDINQLTGRGIPVITELATVLGTTEENVKKMVETGKVGFPELEQAFTNMTAEGATFGGLMEAQSATFLGQVSNIQDSLGQLMVSMGQSLLPLAKQIGEGFAMVTDVFKNMSPELKEAIAQAIALALGLAGLVTTVAGLIALLNPVTLGIAAIVAAFLLWKTKGQEIMDFFQPWLADMEGIFNKLTAIISSNWETIQGLIDAAFVAISMSWELFWATFSAAFQIAWDLLIGIVSASLSAITGDWNGAWMAIQSMFMGVWDTMNGYVTAVADVIYKYIKEQLAKIGLDFDGMIESVTTAWTNFWDGLEKIVTDVVSAIQTVINGIIETIDNVVSGIRNMITEIGKIKIPGFNIGGFQFGGPQAAGGPVTGGTSYLVGEKGPELFTPSRSGSIIPNHKIGGGGGGVVVNINGLISSREVAEQYADQIVRKLQLSSAVV